LTTAARLGPALRALRKRNNWTLSDVAQRTGLSVSTLSKAERNQLSLTYDKLVQLAQGLKVDITTFFEDDTHHASNGIGIGRRSVNRRDDGQVIQTPNHHYVYLSTDLEFGPMVRHAGEEFAYVLEGTCEIHTEHYAPVQLQAGESMYFDSGMAHAYVALGDVPCRVLSICSAPEATLREAMNQHLGAPATATGASAAPPARSTRKKK
jgi:transcriptional regulator with XRE-family HTH domain